MTSLVPVVELTPGSFSQRERPLPVGSAAESLECWFQYWSDSLEDAGIVGLKPWARGSWLVPVRELGNQEVLRAILRSEFRDVENWVIEEIGTIHGGFVLSHEDTELLPGCCGDLGDLCEWEKAAAHRDDSWATVWIGHPWTHVRAFGDLLEFAEPTEHHNPAKLVKAVQLRRDSLLRAVLCAREEVDAFAQRLIPLVQDFTSAIAAAEVVDVLVRGH